MKKNLVLESILILLFTLPKEYISQLCLLINTSLRINKKITMAVIIVSR